MAPTSASPASASTTPVPPEVATAASLALGSVATAGGDTPEWRATVQRVKPGIVALRVTSARSFEDCNPGTWCGTGFVVDAEAGLILSNRHVITVGPVRAMAYFDQNEELPCKPLYRDPCHDFGLLSFDPGGLEFTQTVAIPLRPEGLVVGTEIRVIGNDNAEKLQILQGTVARVDRNAPEYAGLYSDQNTFYAGAASATSGGSSGSPVLNIHGHAVALNAGGAQDAASAYYLPLDRVAYAVDALRAGRLPRRGTFGCTLVFKTYADAERQGLRPAQKAAAVAANAAWAVAVPGRQPRRGVLVCDRVLPGSAAAQAGVAPGDVLLSVSGKCCVDFVELERAIDAVAPEPWSSVSGGELTVVWARLGEERTTSLRVVDLHPLVPRGFVECGAAVLHAVSYHRALRWHLPMEGAGAYLSLAGLFGGGVAAAGAVITELSHNGRLWPVHHPDGLFKALREIPDDAYFFVRFRDWSGSGHGRERTTEVRMDRRLWPLTKWRFEPALPDRWFVDEDATALPTALSPTNADAMEQEDTAPSGIEGLASVPPQSPARALAEVSFFVHTRFMLEGTKPRGVSATLFRSRGVGVVVDLENRLLITARSVVPQLLGTVEVTFAKSLTMDAEPLFIHPELNVVVLQAQKPFPPGVVAVQLPGPNQRDAAVFDAPRDGRFIGLDHRGHPVERECTVSVGEVWNPPILSPPRPRQGTNCELLQALNDEEIADSLGGVFCFEEEKEEGSDALGTEDGAQIVEALFFEFVYDNTPEYHYIFGVSSAAFFGTLAAATQAASRPCRTLPQVTFPSLELELGELSFAGARKVKQITPDRLAAIAQQRPLRRTVMVVERLFPGGAAVRAGIRQGDVILNVSGHPLAGPFDLQKALEAIEANSVSVDVWRDGVLQTLDVEVAALPAGGVRRLLCWNGMICVETPRAYAEAWGRWPEHLVGVTVVTVLLGSPAGEEMGLRSNTWIRAVDGRPVHSLDDLRNPNTCPVDASPNNGATVSTSTVAPAPVVVTLVDGNGVACVRALRPDPTFWPTVELHMQDLDPQQPIGETRPSSGQMRWVRTLWPE